MANFIMLMGPSYSGKSTVALELREELRKKGELVEIMSSDNLREELYGDASIQGDNGKLFSELNDRTINAIRYGRSVIYDATNLSAKKRITLCKRVRNTDPYVLRKLVVCCPPASVLYDRVENSERERKVPKRVVNRQLMSFQSPCLAEGWDQIIMRGCVVDNYNYLDNILEAFKEMGHDNPHHRLTITEHCYLAEKKVVDMMGDGSGAELIKKAARYHDIGKFFTKTFTNTRGERTDAAHYYGHECLGAYLYLSYTGDKEGAWLITNHMRAYSWTDTAYHKFMAHSLEESLAQLKVLHEADKEAH